jgi:hypothetical protein
MTSDGIATEDWDEVHELAIRIVNLSTEGDERGGASRAGWRASAASYVCSHLAMKGAPAGAIQELAGHKDLDAAVDSPESTSVGLRR